ncbi:hypothetical protein ACFV8Z_17420 [Streptomyces sp. NPDC059837]|nr:MULTISPECIES: hypothetical protein [unclassified Streptomyces]MCX4404530.1 hypothetical protein [Streptomyces sp. NBC_01764]MCX5190933.1 hypothetical protein [Streptomyces sp. NBC_00268]
MTYPTMTRSLLGMCDHLRCLRVTPTGKTIWAEIELTEPDP